MNKAVSQLLDHPGWSLLCLAALSLMGACQLQLHWQMIFAVVPLDYYESTMPVTTDLIARGLNPYGLDSQPMKTDLYPPLINLLAAPLSIIFSNNLPLHRAISAMFILLSAALCYRVVLFQKGARIDALTVCTLVYAACLYFGTPVASGNAVGLFCFLACIYLPLLRNFDRTSLIWALLFGGLAFYAKQYFVLGLGYITLYMFLCISMRRALVFGLACATLIFGSLAVVHSSSPYYLDNTLFAVGYFADAIMMKDYMLRQLLEFGEIYVGPICLILVILYKQLRTKDWLANYSGMRTSKYLDAPMLRIHVNYPFYCFVISTLIIVLFLGRNPGNWLTYLMQLMAPTLLVASYSLLANSAVSRGLVTGFSLWTMAQSHSFLAHNFEIDMQPWQKADTLIASHERILASPLLTDRLLTQGKEIFQTGHTPYFKYAAQKPDIFKHSIPSQEVANIWLEYQRELYRRLEEKEIDLIIVTVWDLRGIFENNPQPDTGIEGFQILKENYFRDGSLPLSMIERPGGGKYNMQIWRPKRKE